MIPRILHQVWLGDAPMPEQFQAFRAQWAELNPGWEMRLHDERSVTNLRLFGQLTSLSAKSDLLRYEVLERFGGVYADTDFEPLRPLDELLANVPGMRAFAAWEDEKRVCTALMGAEAGHPAVQALLADLPTWAQSHKAATPDTQTGPVFLTRTWLRRPDVTLLPPATFYPVSYWDRGDLADGGRPEMGTAYAVHHWGRSWMPAEKREADDRAMAVRNRKIAFLVPRCSDGGWRDRSWAWLKPRWAHHFPGAQIVEGHSTPFNRSEAINRAAARAAAESDPEVYVIIDADSWVLPDAVRTAISTVEDYVHPWKRGYKLTASATDSILKADPLTTKLGSTFVTSNLDAPEHQHLSGCVVVTRAAFEAVGGFDERFEGWGFEDTAFIYSLDARAGRREFNPRGDANLIHLWHPPAPDQGDPSPGSEALFNDEYRTPRGLPPWRRGRDR